ncbi:MAG TPA: zinc-binding alcohol dehydrogenase family protein [Terracidiphilus sp.]|jgi:NADPH:quinone reductase-like Zn-dependent oxidoreductase|nr:zinc-binding alcohol dehydrogenase family protein [Terracidiphilus sp.]
MHAAVIHNLGQPPRYESFPEPQPQDGEALIHVRAAGLHPIVKALASGSHYAGGGELPMVPGVDGIGTLDDGSRVYFAFARKPWGTMSERTVVPRAKCLPVPDGLDDTLAAAIPNPGMSAWLSLKERASLTPGETVLISGATGVAGRLAVQVARHLGARRVIGAGRSLDLLHAAGVDVAIDLAQPEDAIRDAFAAQAEKGIDVIIDYLWGRPTELLLEALTRGFRESGGPSIRMVEVGDVAGKKISLPGSTLRSIDLKLLGSGFGSVPIERVLDAISTLFALAAKGDLTVDIAPTPLSEVESAWDRNAEGARIVFTTGGGR